jgi:aldehyde dehydrogenase (NAD+)
LCGNTVVFKPATYTPLVGIRFAEILNEAGLPPGVLNIITGSGGVVGDVLVEHPDVAIISFTGSTSTGLAIAEKCARRGTRVSLEMGGKNAAIVMADADLDLATDALIWSAFGTTGQRCTACSRIIVHAPARRELTDRLVARAKALRLGDGLLPTTDVGPVVSESQLESIHAYVEIGRQEGGRVLTGGGRAADGALARGSFYAPTIFDNVTPGMRIEQEEIFGPVVDLIEARDLDEAVRILNGVEYGLSASIFTRDVNTAMRAIDDIMTGIVYVNHGTIGAEVHLPFGGTKHTGNGHREGGIQALDVFSEWKAVYVDYSGRLQRAQIDKD